MTREQEQQFNRLRLLGMDVREIANRIGVDYEQIRAMLSARGTASSRRPFNTPERMARRRADEDKARREYGVNVKYADIEPSIRWG